jgi:hypothetical protein
MRAARLCAQWVSKIRTPTPSKTCSRKTWTWVATSPRSPTEKIVSTLINAIACAFVAMAVFSGISSYNASHNVSRGGFVDEDIESMKRSIKREFASREGVRVIEVDMMQESASKATGFVKLEIEGLGKISKSCSATMEQSGKRYIWQCN